MKEFKRLVFDPDQCLESLQALERLLASKEELEENGDCKPFFESHPHLLLLIGNAYSARPARFDLYAHQYPLFGDFSCDLAMGDSTTSLFGFVELEDAIPGSLFRQQGKKATPEWGTRLEKANSQVIDWFWKMDDMARTDDYRARFGLGRADYFGLIVIGRDVHLDHPREQSRWAWRSRKVLVDGRPVQLVTYDQLHRDLSMMLRSTLGSRLTPTPPT